MSKPYHHGDLPEALIAATLALLETTPADRITVADAARTLGVSSGAPFRHFKDRDELMAHVAAAGFQRLNVRTTEAFERHPLGSIDRIVAGGVAYIRFSAENPNLFNLMWGAARRDYDNEVAAQAGAATYSGFVENLKATMSAEGFGDRNVDAFGAPLWTMVHGYADLVVGGNRWLDRDPAHIAAQVERATYAYFRGMTAE